MNERIIGYILLTAGILFMFGALLQVFLVFTGKTNPLPVFSVASPRLSLEAFMPKPPSEITLPQVNSQGIELIPTDAFNKMLNMFTTIFLMGFLLSFGFKIASLGVMMLRPIVVKVSGKTEIPA